MDDDYDNYVPQISTMDWQNLGQDNESNQMRVESSASAMGPSGSGSYLYGVAGASIPVAGRSQHHQRSFPGMGMPTQPFGVAEYGQGQGYQTNDFVSSGPQSQMMNYQMQSQPVRSFDPMNPNYMTGDPSRQNMLQQGIISAATNAKSTKGTKGSKKSRKAMAADQCSNSNQLEPQGIQSTKHMQVHKQLHITNQPYDISNAALKGPGPPANLSAFGQASIQNAPHQSGTI
uniref:Uncharacterized protein n=2 Tax=Meloidogyne TaxID=189290 RepID=A0A915NTR5_9BILA